jgi:hypothetical protein
MRRIVFYLMAVLIAGFAVNSKAEAGILLKDNVSVYGSVTATFFSGSGANLTNIPGTALTNATITTNQLHNSAVTADKLADTAVTTNKLADSAVTAGKIAFYGRVAIVATSGGDYDDPATAMSSYSEWCGTPSSMNPCLLKIMPGVYDVGSSSVVMRQYIDIEGSGEKITKIAGTNGSGTVLGASNAEMRFLTIENTGTGASIRAIYNASTSPSILHVTVKTSGGISTSSYGVSNDYASSTIMTNVTVTVSGGGKLWRVQQLLLACNEECHSYSIGGGYTLWRLQQLLLPYNDECHSDSRGWDFKLWCLQHRVRNGEDQSFGDQGDHQYYL